MRVLIAVVAIVLLAVSAPIIVKTAMRAVSLIERAGICRHPFVNFMQRVMYQVKP